MKYIMNLLVSWFIVETMKERRGMAHKIPSPKKPASIFLENNGVGPNKLSE